MKMLKIYDPAMCCSTGVCGPDVDSSLIQLAGFLKGLNPDEVKVERFNLAQQPDAYASNPAVSAAMKEKGANALPLVFIDGQLVSSGSYPSLDELAQRLGVKTSSEGKSNSCCSGGCC